MDRGFCATAPRGWAIGALAVTLCGGGEHLSRCAGQEADLSAAGYEELADRRDAYSRTWVQREPATGEVVAQVVEIGARLNYWDAAAGAWTPTRIAFEPQADGSALVLRAPDRIRLEPVLAPSSAVTLTKPAEGFEIRLAPAGIGYYDRATGTYEELAAVRPAPLTLDPGTGYAGYLDAFDRLAADIVLIHGISGLAQEVVFRELPPAPTELGYPSDQGVDLVVLTEIVNAADLEAQGLWWQGAGAEGELSTEALDLREAVGGYLFGFLDGFAYYLDGELAVGAPPRGGDLDEVAKGILIIDDRAYLAEVVPPALLGRSELAHAPASRWSMAPAEERDVARPDRLRGPASEEARRGHLALLRSGAVPGLVLDYTAYSGVLNQNTEFHWRRTYLIKGVVGWNSGYTLTIHPGAIIKFQTEDLDETECVPLSSYIRIPPGASLQWESDPARITIFTSSCDSSVGDDTRKETTCESGCTPAPGDYPYALRLEGTLVPPAVLEYFELRYSYSGLFLSSGGAGRTVRHAKFLENSVRGIATTNTDLVLKNCLFSNSTGSGYGVHQGTSTVKCHASNCTFDRVNKAIYQSHSAPTCTIDYCLFTNVSDIYAASSGSNCAGCSSKAFRYWKTGVPTESWLNNGYAVQIDGGPYDNADLAASYFYLKQVESDLIDVDSSQSASGLLLGWFNTARNRTPEGIESPIDVGFHYWESDQDLDLLVDAAEDVNQNGAHDSSPPPPPFEGDQETDYLDPDTDNDGLLDGYEKLHLVANPNGWPYDPPVVTTNPLDADTDGDGYGDGWEMLYGFDPLDPDSPQAGLGGPDYDPDGDGIPTATEHATDWEKLSPRSFDSDMDGLVEGGQIPRVTAYPAGVDLDDNGYVDGEDLEDGAKDPDRDDDGLRDGWELELGFNPDWNADADPALIAHWTMNRIEREGAGVFFPDEGGGQSDRLWICCPSEPEAPLKAPGVLGDAFLFAPDGGGAGYGTVQTPNGSDFDDLEDDFTIALWFVGPGSSQDLELLLGWGSFGSEAGFRVFVDDATLQAEVCYAGTCEHLQIEEPLVTPERWHRAVLRVGGQSGEASLFLDNEPPDSEGPSGTVVRAGVLYLGYAMFGTPLEGLIDDVRVYSRALTDAELVELGAPESPSDRWRWYSMGPGGGGWVEALAVSPVDSDVVYAGSDVGGFLRSLDGGFHWQIENTGMSNRWVEAILPGGDASSVWAATRGGLYEWDQEESRWFLCGASAQRLPFSDLKFDARRGQNAYILASIGTRREDKGAAPQAAEQGRIYESQVGTRGLARWGAVPNEGNPVSQIYGLAFGNYKGATCLYAATSGGVFVDETGLGTGWTPLVNTSDPNVALADSAAVDVSVWDVAAVEDGSGATVLCAAQFRYLGPNPPPADHSIYRLRQDNPNDIEWVVEKEFWASDSKYLVDLAADPSAPYRVYATFIGSGGDCGSYRRLLNGTWKPSLSGQEITGGASAGYGLVYSGWKREAGLSGWSVAVGPDGRVYVGDRFFVWRNDQYGIPMRWYSVTSRPVEESTSSIARYQGYGFENTISLCIHADPVVPGKLFAGYADIALGVSPDGGASWRMIRDRDLFQNRVYYLLADVFDMAVDPDNPQRVWSSFGLRNKHYGRAGGVIFSEDGGAQWELLDLRDPAGGCEHMERDRECPQGNVCALLLVEDPEAPHDPDQRTLFAGMNTLVGDPDAKPPIPPPPAPYDKPSLWRWQRDPYPSTTWSWSLHAELSTEYSWIRQLIRDPDQPDNCVVVLESLEWQTGEAGLFSYPPSGAPEVLCDLSETHAKRPVCALFVPAAGQYERGFLIGTRSAGMGPAVTPAIADIYWIPWEGEYWGSPRRQHLWTDVLPGLTPTEQTEIGGRGFVGELVAHPYDPRAAYAAVGFEMDRGRQEGTGATDIPVHYGLGIIRLDRTDGLGDDVWQATRLPEEPRRPLPLSKARAVVTDPHHVNRLYAGTDGAGIAVGIRSSIAP